MSPPKSIVRVGRFLRKTIGSIKSICFGRHNNLPNTNTPLLIPFSCSRSCAEDPQNDKEGGREKAEKKNTGLAEARYVSLNQQKRRQKKVGQPCEETKRRGDVLAQTMRDLNMVDLRDVEHALDVREALRCYSSIRSPVYLDIVDNFFTDMYYEFSDPHASSSTYSSRKRAESFRL